jgi:NAD-dependent dihydropyrimidine dehydrogenase PreA subunit
LPGSKKQRGGLELAEEKKKYKFTYEIKKDLCMDCATCWYVCTNDGGSGAVYVSLNGSANYAINSDTCTRCGRCLRACPVNAVEKLAAGAEA